MAITYHDLIASKCLTKTAATPYGILKQDHACVGISIQGRKQRLHGDAFGKRSIGLCCRLGVRDRQMAIKVRPILLPHRDSRPVQYVEEM